MPNYRVSCEKANDLPREAIKVPEWPLLDDEGKPLLDANGDAQCTWYVRSMTLGERKEFDARIMYLKDGKTEVDQKVVRSELLIRALCDESGQRIFGDEDIPLLEGKCGETCTRIFLAAQRLSGLDKTEKNS